MLCFSLTSQLHTENKFNTRQCFYLLEARSRSVRLYYNLVWLMTRCGKLNIFKKSNSLLNEFRFGDTHTDKKFTRKWTRTVSISYNEWLVCFLSEIIAPVAAV